MAKIHVLDKQVAELVAAGEVVERPASVIKELVENAVDAGSTAITVEIRNGGVSYMRVTDNGCGIPSEEVTTAFLRHATSKITTATDLEAIGTLGFRGEALAAIATVSRVEMMTKTADSDTGCRAILEGGELLECYETGCREGTTIVVRDLFYNTPARLKFLKRDVSEANAVAGVLERLALSRPEISVRFFRDGKESLYTPGNGRLFSAIYSVLGKDYATDIMEVNYEREGVTVSGFITKPYAAQATRNMQMFFLNGRYVRSRTSQAAVEEAYRNSMATGKYPGCVLMIGMDLHAVDVNIHPAKTEVRFVNERPVFDAVYFAVKSLLEAGKTTPKMTLSPNSFTSEVLRSLPSKDIPLQAQEPSQNQAEKPSEYTDKTPEPQPSTQSYIYKPFNKSENRYLPEIDITVSDDDKQPLKTQPDTILPENAKKIDNQQKNIAQRLPMPEYRLLGEVFTSYILIETAGEMLLIDKHAAHERVLFEQLVDSAGNIPRQTLLAPIAISLSSEEYNIVINNLDLLAEAGFMAEDLGGGVILRELPAYINSGDAKDVLAEIISNLAEGGASRQTRRLDEIYHITACKAAIKAGSKNDPEELMELIREVFTNPKIRYCPHGRPVIVTMTKYELDKKFGRV